MPPRRNFGSSNLPVVIAKEKKAYQAWLILHRNFPKTERFGIDQKIDQSFLNALEWSSTASYLPPERKIILLEKILSRLDVLKFFPQLILEFTRFPLPNRAENNPRGDDDALPDATSPPKFSTPV